MKSKVEAIIEYLEPHIGKKLQVEFSLDWIEAGTLIGLGEGILFLQPPDLPDSPPTVVVIDHIKIFKVGYE